MKNLVALLCLICVPVISVFFNKCYFCESNQSTCNETETECISGCMTISESINTSLLYKAYVRCCSGNMCNTHGYEFSESNSIDVDTMPGVYLWRVRKCRRRDRRQSDGLGRKK